MDHLHSSPMLTVGQELATFLACCGILHKAWEEILSAAITNVNTFVLNEYEDVVYVTFPSHYMEDFTVIDGEYGECTIQNGNKIFSACLKGDNDQPVLVHKGALRRFLNILESSDFNDQIQSVVNQEREQAIIFVGHSIGGAVATLAMLWFLEKRVTKFSSFCITFGSPLVGNLRLGEVISHEDWSGKFCHLVSKYDIVPRMFLAPYESIVEPLNEIFPQWKCIMGNTSISVPHPSIQEACRTLLHNVLQYTSTIANNETKVSALKSPYRSFGTYMFCSSCGATCIDDPEAILRMLHYTMQSIEGMSFDEIAGSCISEHTGYGHMLEHITEYLLNTRKIADHTIEYLVNTRRIANPISDSLLMGIALQLEAMGVGAQNDHAYLALKKAEEVKVKHGMNIAKLNDKLSKNQSTMAWLEWYKGLCNAEGTGFYDCFKRQSDRKDVKADLLRKLLGGFWDEIVDMEKKHELPSNLEFRNKWINAGNTYRRLVESMDIADYYRTHEGSGSYLAPGVRYQRHIALEKWMKEKDQTRIGRDKKPRTMFASLTQDSCFWAYLEEARKALACLQRNQHQHQVMCAQFQESLEKFEDYVRRMIRDRNISVEVFLEKSSFMTWWQQYRELQLQSPQWKSNPPLFSFMENESWRLER